MSLFFLKNKPSLFLLLLELNYTRACGACTFDCSACWAVYFLVVIRIFACRGLYTLDVVLANMLSGDFIPGSSACTSFGQFWGGTSDAIFSRSGGPSG